MKKSMKILVTALLTLIIGGVGLSTVALAHDGGIPFWHGPGPRGGGWEAPGRTFGAGPGLWDRGSMAATLAEALGISVEELQTYRDERVPLPQIVEDLGLEMEQVQEALAAARTAAVEAAVEAGELTREEADRLLERAGGVPFPGLRRDPGRAHEWMDRESMAATLAEALGISVEELQTYRDERVPLPQIVEDLGLEMEQVQEALAAARTAAVEAAVEAGELTRQEADRLLEFRGGDLDGPGRHPGRDRRGMPHPWRGAAPDEEGFSWPDFLPFFGGRGR